MRKEKAIVCVSTVFLYFLYFVKDTLVFKGTIVLLALEGSGFVRCQGHDHFVSRQRLFNHLFCQRPYSLIVVKELILSLVSGDLCVCCFSADEIEIVL